MTETDDSPALISSSRRETATTRSRIHALLLPIKDLRNAKQRLAGVLTTEERFGLAQAMLADTIRTVQRVQYAQTIFVVTNYEPAIELATTRDWEIVKEGTQVSESASVDFASRLCAARGIDGLLRLPVDLPLVQALDIDELLDARCRAPAVVMVPSRDGTGTNAILRMPPTLFPSHFGPNSFAKHRREAEQAGATILVRRNVRLEMDVDDESDLRALLQFDLSETSTGKWLEESGVAARFKPGRFSAQASS